MLRTPCILRPALYALIFALCIELAIGFECNSSMDDDRHYYDQPVIIYLQDYYCFVNEFTIRIKESNVLLCVVNNTDDGLMATNTTHLFFSFSSHNMSYCSSDASDASNPSRPTISTPLYAIRITVLCLSITVAIAIISIHLMFKELRTIPGFLVIILCISLTFSLTVDFIWTALFDYHKILDITAESCKTFSYLASIAMNSYEVSKTAILIHFAYVMYRSYKLFGNQENERSLLCKYIIVIVGMSIFFPIILITVDLTANIREYVTPDGGCVNFFTNSISFEVHNVFVVAFAIIYIVLQFTLVIIGSLFYYLNTRQCCLTSSGLSKHFRIFIILAFTIDLNNIIALIFLALPISLDILFTAFVAICGIQQAVLFVLFASSSKVTCHCMKEGEHFANS